MRILAVVALMIGILGLALGIIAADNAEKILIVSCGAVLVAITFTLLDISRQLDLLYRFMRWQDKQKRS